MPIHAQSSPIQVLCTTLPVYVFTQNIANQIADCEVSMMLSPKLGCPHNYSLTPRDMQRIARANVLVINGLGLEEFLGTNLSKVNAKLVIVDSSKGILEKEMGLSKHADEEGDDKRDEHAYEGHDQEDCDHAHEGCNHEGHDHAHQGPYNPHIFTSPRLAIAMVENIRDGLSQYAPQHKEKYYENARMYIAKLQALHAQIEKLAQKIKGKKIVTHHNIFDYLAKDLGLEVVCTIQQISGQEPIASNMLAIIQKIKEAKVIAIFTEPQYRPKIAQRIAQETSVPLFMLDPCITGPDHAPLDYYETVIQQNLVILQETLNHGNP